MKPPINAPNVSTIASQMRKRTTATERNRARGVINGYSNDLLKNLEWKEQCSFARVTTDVFYQSVIRQLVSQEQRRDVWRQASSRAHAG